MRHFRARAGPRLADQRSADRDREGELLPEVVEFLYYKQGGWLSVLLVTTNAN